MNKDTKKSDKKQAATLPSLAKKINREHVACEKDIRSALDHARQCGQDLIAAKGLVKFGEFETWVVKNCKFSPRMARRYMTIAGGWKRFSTFQNGHARPKCRLILYRSGRPFGFSRQGDRRN